MPNLRVNGRNFEDLDDNDDGSVCFLFFSRYEWTPSRPW